MATLEMSVDASRLLPEGVALLLLLLTPVPAPAVPPRWSRTKLRTVADWDEALGKKGGEVMMM